MIQNLYNIFPKFGEIFKLMRLSSMNPRKNKYKENHTQAHYSQTAENQRLKKKKENVEDSQTEKIYLTHYDNSSNAWSLIRNIEDIELKS